MRIKSIILVILFMSILLSSFPQNEVKAETKTIVVPDDFSTVQEAIENAAQGDTVFVKKGTYEGPINQTIIINKTICLKGEDSENTILNLHPLYVESTLPFFVPYYKNALLIEARDVELSDFTFKGQGHIHDEGNNTQIKNNILSLYLWLNGQNCTTSLNQMYGVSIMGTKNTVSNNTFTGGIDLRFGSENIIRENLVVNGSCIGLVESSNNKIFYNTVINSEIGVALCLRSSYNFVYKNVILNNNIGLTIEVDGNNNIIYENYVANNNYALNFRLYSEGGDNTTIYHNNFINNTGHVKIDKPWNDDVYYGTYYLDNGEEGNYWSNYIGTDNDGDGIGEIPFIIDSHRQRQDNYPLMTPYEIESINIPEFPSWALLLTTMVAGVAAVFFFRDMLKKKRRFDGF